jgi:nucleotidyltransferase substrate binding protein (TIGR01987 family)
MTKKEAKIRDLDKAITKFAEAYDLYTKNSNTEYEISWKVMQELANEANLQGYGPKASIRNAAQMELISNPELWLEFTESRNLVSHTYVETIAANLAKKLETFLPLLKDLQKNLQNNL